MQEEEADALAREPLLLIPGPTMVPEQVRNACARQMISHRGAEFLALHDDVVPRLEALFKTGGAVTVLPCSGTGALEALIANTLSPGDRVLSCVMGAFGERFAAIAAAYGLDVDRIQVPWGEVPQVDEVTGRLRGAGQRYRAVLLTHSETSTGALLPLQEIAPAIRAVAPDILILVDMVSSFAGVPVQLDAWGIDGAATASQKALMTPPGLGIVALGPRGLEAAQSARLPRFALDLRPYLEKPGQPPYTPAVGLWFGLQAALDMIDAEGEANVYRRHRLMSDMTRAGVRALGLEPLVDDAFASPTVTAIQLPERVPAGELLRLLKERYGVILAGGQGQFRGRVVRLGHMGAVTPQHVLTALDALDEAAMELRIADQPGAGPAARAVLNQAAGNGGHGADNPLEGTSL